MSTSLRKLFLNEFEFIGIFSYFSGNKWGKHLEKKSLFLKKVLAKINL
jgi:hypothetical protein